MWKSLPINRHWSCNSSALEQHTNHWRYGSGEWRQANPRFEPKLSFLFHVRVSYVEEQALKNLVEKFSANKSRLLEVFVRHDPDQTGAIKTAVSSRYPFKWQRLGEKDALAITASHSDEYGKRTCIYLCQLFSKAIAHERANDVHFFSRLNVAFHTRTCLNIFRIGYESETVTQANAMHSSF